MMQSLRSRVIAGMVLLIALVFVIALLGVNSIRSLGRTVDHELTLLLESTDLGNGLVSSVASEIRSAEQYLVRPSDRLRLQMLEEGDSAYAVQRRYRASGLAHDLRSLHRQQDRRQPGADRSGVRHGPRAHRPGPDRRGAAAGGPRAGPVRHPARRRPRAVPGPDQPRHRPRGGSPAPGRSAAADALAALLRGVQHRRLDRDLDRAHGGPPPDPAHRRRRAVRRWRPAPDAAQPDADGARAALPCDGRHGRPAAQRRGLGRRRGEPDGEQRDRFLGDERAARGEQRRDLHRHGEDRLQRGAAGSGDGEGRRPAREPAPDRGGERQGLGESRAAGRPDSGAGGAPPRRRGRRGPDAARRARGRPDFAPGRSRSCPGSRSRSPPSST